MARPRNVEYEVDPSLLNQYVPRGTSLDSFQGKTYLSLVGFRFFRTKMLGYFPIPFHANFDEVNLRFYVRHKEGSEDRRGVVFIAEVVPRRAIAATARLLYGENYICLPMRRRVETEELRTTFEYHWKVNDNWSKLSVQTLGAPTHPREGSLEQFITEHYWGYSKQRAGSCLEYRVAHEPWKVCATSSAKFEGDVSTLYGKRLAAVLERPPDCAFVADGSPVIVFKGNRIQ